jgi:hypothetical protein
MLIMMRIRVLLLSRPYYYKKVKTWQFFRKRQTPNLLDLAFAWQKKLCVCI